MNIERIAEFIKEENIPVRIFENAIGASNGLIRKAIKNKTDIQSKWITNILEVYPMINAEWLLTGIGEMYKLEQKEYKEALKYYAGHTKRQVFELDEYDRYLCKIAAEYHLYKMKKQ